MKRVIASLRRDCRHFLGWKPCPHGQCDSCASYAPARPRILLVKLGAAGDVVRTTCILRRLRGDYPQAHITWVVERENEELLANNALLDRVLPMQGELALILGIERFDIAFGLEHDALGAAVATACKAQVKRGFLLSEEGKLVPADDAADYWYRLGLSDELKFRENRKTYQEYMFETCGYAFAGESHVLELTAEERRAAHRLWNQCSFRRPVIGINLGGSARFAGRHWPDCHVLETVRRLSALDHDVILLAGAAEHERARHLASRSPGAIAPRPASKRMLAALIERLAVLVTSDTLALHLASAVRARTVALFGGTSWHEFETYDLAEKLTAELPCSPCYRSHCARQECMAAISPESVLSAVERALTGPRAMPSRAGS
jgi:ADP-heptose:LPS heptosyltransferase